VRRSRAKHAGGAEPATQPQNMPASTAKVLNALIVGFSDRCNGNECRPGRSGGSARHAPHAASCLSVASCVAAGNVHSSPCNAQ
jgi:hypothetical protein